MHSLRMSDEQNPPVPAIIKERDRLYARAMELTDGEFVVDDGLRLASPSWFVARRLRRAIRLLRRVVEINPYAWPAWFMMGKSYERLGSVEAALDAFKRAIEINPFSGTLAKEACAQAMKLEYHDWALEMGELAVKYSPNDPAAHSNLGVIYLITGRSVDAESELKKTLELEPENSSTQRLITLVQRVIAGELDCPTKVAEVGSMA